MNITDLQKRAYELCLKAGRYEIIPELACMDSLQLSGLITWLLRLQES
ncbi:hypothetical protein [Methylophilus sp. 5]|nr:hypothetical protein [Methylophilus sp. 5]